MTDNVMPKVATKPRARALKTTVMPPPAPPQPAARTASKSDNVIKLLLRAKGATPVELIAATDWQPHSVRAFLSGLRKKGRVIVREPRKNGDAAYRIVIATELADGSLTTIVSTDTGTDGAAAASDGQA